MREKEIIERTAQAVEYFKEGYNCSQSVSMAYADVFNLDLKTVKSISGSFGAGMGRMREVCGGATGMFMILGMKYPILDPNDVKAKEDNYAAVQRTAAKFKERLGSLICADLIDVERAPQDVTPSDRNAEYYATRPCALCVAVGAEILGRELLD